MLKICLIGGGMYYITRLFAYLSGESPKEYFKNLDNRGLKLGLEDEIIFDGCETIFYYFSTEFSRLLFRNSVPWYVISELYYIYKYFGELSEMDLSFKKKSLLSANMLINNSLLILPFVLDPTGMPILAYSFYSVLSIFLIKFV